MKSMTGFGKNEITIDGRRLRVEIKSVNQRFLDINIRLPRFLMFLEEEIRKYIKSRISRGRVDVFLNYYSEREDSKKVNVDLGLISAYYKAAQEIEKSLGIEGSVTVSELMRLPDAVTFEENDGDEEAFKQLVLKTLEGAVDELIAAREEEGEKLMKDIRMRLETILSYAQKVEAKEDVVVKEYRDKLKERLSVLLEGADVDEARLAQEVAIFADKCNITEEVVRIKSHVKHFEEAEKSDKPQGRNLDFIVQELNREFNTIGSKSSDAEITGIVIAGKGEIEKIREQIQNIE